MDGNGTSEVDVNGKNDASVLESMLVHKATPEYLQELLKDKKQLQNLPNIFMHLEFLLEKEITRVRQKLFHINESVRKTENELPEPSGVIVNLQEKVFVPVKEYPNYNFVGRLLGPRGLTAKQLEQDLECKIMVRGRGSLRDKRKEDMNRGKPNWEHLDEELHVLVSVEDYENRASIKLRRASETIRAFLEQGVQTPENEDRLKQLQLMELAVLNDKDRQQAHVQQAQQHQQLILQHHTLTVLNNQAAAAAAAAQFLQPNNQYTMNNLLTRLQSQSSPQALTANCLYPAAALQTAGTIQSITNSVNNNINNNGGTNTNLANYIQNSNLSGSVLCPLAPNSALSAAMAAAAAAAATANHNGHVNIGLPLSQLTGNVAGNGLSDLSLSMGTNLQTTGISSNLINCTPNQVHDHFSAVAAALLGSGTANQAVTSNFSSLASVNSNPIINNSMVGHNYPMTSLTSSIADAVNIFDYNNATSIPQESVSSGSFKLRPINSTQTNLGRMHPYLRPS